MRDNKNNPYFKMGLNGLLIVCGGILFYYILFHSDRLSALIGAFFSMLTPIIAGLIIAYILNPVMRFIELRLLFPLWNKIKPKKDHTYAREAKTIRFISAFITLIMFIAVIYGLVMSLMPQLIVNVQSILGRIPVYLMNVNDYYSNVLVEYPKL